MSTFNAKTTTIVKDGIIYINLQDVLNILARGDTQDIIRVFGAKLDEHNSKGIRRTPINNKP